MDQRKNQYRYSNTLKRPSQRREWYGDAAIKTAIRFILVSRFPNVPFRLLDNFCIHLVTNKHLSDVGEKLSIGGANLFEALAGWLFEKQKLNLLNLLGEKLIEHSKAPTYLLEAYNKDNNDFDRYVAWRDFNGFVTKKTSSNNKGFEQ